jgi:hypothetical protein
LSRARSAKWRVRGDLKSEGVDGLIAALNHKPDLLTETTARGKRPLEDHAEGGFHEISTMIGHGPGAGPHTTLMSRIANYARRIEAAALPASGPGSLWAEPSIR